MSSSNQTGMEAGVDTAVPAGYALRIQPEAFTISVTVFLIVAIVAAAARTGLRYCHYRKLHSDDYFLFYAVVTATVCAGVAYTIKDLIYTQIYVGLYWEKPGPDFYGQMLVFEQRIQVCSFLIWSCIYAIKFSFLCLFRKLVDRIRPLEIFWWVVTSITIVCGLASMPLGFIICPNFTPDYMQYCPIESQLFHERIYLDVTSALDIFTDLLIISVPVALLWNVKISLRRKLALGSMLCLSVASIVMALIRTTLAPLPTGIIDTSWLIFWQAMEAATAIIMISLSAFRGLFGQEALRGSKRSKPLLYRPTKESNQSANSRGKQGTYEEIPRGAAGALAKPRPLTFARYKGGSVMDEETQMDTMYDMEMETTETGGKHSRMASTLDRPFSPSEYTAAAYH